MQEDPLADSPASSENGDDAVAGGTPRAAPEAAPGAQQDQPLGNYAFDELYDDDDRPAGPIAPRANAPLAPNRQEGAPLPAVPGTVQAVPGPDPGHASNGARADASTLEERTRLFWAKLEKDRLDSDLEAARERSLQEATKREQDRLDSDLEAARKRSLQEAEADKTVDDELTRVLRESSLVEVPRTQQEEEDFKRALQESLDHVKVLEAQEEAELKKAHQLSMQEVARRQEQEEQDCLKAHHNSLKDVDEQELRRKKEDAELERVRKESLQTALEWETSRQGWWSDVDDTNITANDTSSVAQPQSATLGTFDDNAGSNVATSSRNESRTPAVVAPTAQRHPIYGFLQGHWAESTISSQLTLPPYTTTENLPLPSSLDPHFAVPPLLSPSPVATIGGLRANAPIEEQRRRDAYSRRTDASNGQVPAQPDVSVTRCPAAEEQDKNCVLEGRAERIVDDYLCPGCSRNERLSTGQDFDEMYDDDDRWSATPSTAATGIQEDEDLPANDPGHNQEVPSQYAGERPAMSDVHTVPVGNSGEIQRDHATLEAMTKEFWDRRDRERLESDFKKAKELSKRERRIEHERDKAELERFLLESRESEEQRKTRKLREEQEKMERAIQLSKAHARDYPDAIRARKLIQAQREEEEIRNANAESLRSEKLRLERLGWAPDEDDHDDDDTSTIATGLSNMSISNRSLRSHRGIIGHVDDDGGSSIASSTHTVRHRPAVRSGLRYTDTLPLVGEAAPAYTPLPVPVRYEVPQSYPYGTGPTPVQASVPEQVASPPVPIAMPEPMHYGAPPANAYAPAPMPVQANVPEQVVSPPVVTEFGGRVRTPYVGGPIQQGNETVSWQSLGKRLPQP
ncbi:hypothetical protein LTR15_003584 [Elasticomyces elasticus]|nr:hypothetical protein LTR15_003584 [Elasticomyces elasticus]